MLLRSKPVLCNYYLTYRCNAQCSFCDIWEKPSPYADSESFFANLRDLKRLGVKIIDFTGGEPLLHRRAAEFCRLAKAAGFDGMTVVDSQNLSGDPYIALVMAAKATERLMVATGVTNHEPRAAILETVASQRKLALFIAGVLFAYFLLLPLGVTFLIGFTPSGIQPMLSIDRYIGFAAMLIFSTGLMFQVPIVMLLLSVFGMLSVNCMLRS